jgi:uncharacterized membrane protein YphA (DoxX/SURF4 family)
MPVIFVIGRVVFVSYFVFAGLQRLMDVTGSADYFAQKFAIPPAFDTAGAQLASLLGLSIPLILALLAGIIELAAGLLIAFNVGTRVMAVVLIVMTAIGIYYSNDFWDMAPPARDANLALAMLHISLIGGLLVFVALGSWLPGELGRRDDV